MNEMPNFGINFTNFDPNNLEVDETINVVFVIDKSGSIYDYVDDLNNALNDFVETMQKSHVADKMLVSTITFDDDIKVVNGYQPISDVERFNIRPGGLTNLYGAVEKGLDNANDYREQLQTAGITAKTLVFIITDGDDTCGGNPKAVQQKMAEIYKNEANSFTFTVILFGVGNGADYKKAAADMGIRPELVAEVGRTGAEIRKMIGFISSSVSSSAVGGSVNNITF